MPPQHNATPMPHFEFERQMLEQHRLAQVQRHQQTAAAASPYSMPPQNGPYQLQESPTRRASEESQQMQQQRSYLGVEFNRKGRISPLPQAVQGAQAQHSGPGGEPGIKNEFGRMFSGIGSGVGLGVPSPVSAGAQAMPFSNANPLRREELEREFPNQDTPMDNGAPKLARSSSKTGVTSRRRKLKEEDTRGDDESSAGRRTPSGRVKRAKTHHHHHHQEEITRRRAVYGTDIYTDDSDVIAACIHEGWFRGAWAPDVDTKYLDLEIGRQPRVPIGPDRILLHPPPSGPVKVPKGYDAHVKILALPALVEYKSCVRFGIKSREWGVKRAGHRGSHDGMSFKIMSVQWVPEEKGGSLPNRKAAFSQALSAEEEEEETRLAVAFAKVSDLLIEADAAAGQSFERGTGVLEGGEIKGVASKSWNKPKPKKVVKANTSTVLPGIRKEIPPPPTEPISPIAPAPKRESMAAPATAAEAAVLAALASMPVQASAPLPAPVLQEKGVVEMVTERMIENANANSAT
ncbi:putative transcriptional regulatory protein RXT3 [Amylocarpus encephaloides]|uniref:Transcriptional regulatory protein RXT3 n=1 Tax=Amylocarpus encephaloides TaxID=45428 RepID=A0A9P8C2B5_9HELO|nr:putative transcriptional regulatory protein RXT3 [Amylocarpus encephaloides]